MIGEDRAVMTGKELRRVHVIRPALDKKLTQVKAATVLGLTPRQVRRLMTRVRQEGDAGLVHRGRGKPSNRRIAEAVKAKILRRYTTRNGDFGPTLAAEKLAERQGLKVNAETLRTWLLAAGVDHFQRRKRPHRAWRARKAAVGELVQLDGSHHEWFEGRGPQCVVLAYIDDASSRVWARVYEYEGTWPALDSFRRYAEQYGLPLAVYTDKPTTYKSPAAPTLEEQLAGQTPQSQFERSRAELGVEVIHAHSPQAKGRVERLFGTIQDRLIKELRLAGGPWTPPITSWKAICPGTTSALLFPRPRRRICIGPVQPVGRWTASCASRRGGSCGAIGPWRTAASCIRSRPRWVPPMCKWKNDWMERGASRIRARRSRIA